MENTHISKESELSNSPRPQDTKNFPNKKKIHPTRIYERQMTAK